MDKRERMARDKRAKAKAGRVERVLKRRKALDTRRQALKDVAAGRYPGSHGEPSDTDTDVTPKDLPTPSENDATVTAQGESSTA